MIQLKECRICLSEENEKDIVSPCDCKGSVKYVHKECLQKWVDVKGSLKCDICKERYNLSRFQKVDIILNNFMRSLGIFLLIIVLIVLFPIVIALMIKIYIKIYIETEELKKLKLKTLKRRLKRMRRKMRIREQVVN
jgi:hypothetical protein